MDQSSIFITGANGQLGLALKEKFPSSRSTNVGELDISDKQSVSNFDWSGIKVIINAAAYTNVDGAETSEGRIAAWKVNASAVLNLVEIALKHDIILVHISTDYVFDGTLEPHLETEELSPLNVYGQSKAAGDLVVATLPKHYLLRTSWIIGEGKNFVKTMLDLGSRNIAPKVVSDQFGRLTFTSVLAGAIDHLLSNKLAYGLYNVSNDGELASWADISREVFKLAGYDLTITDTSTAEYYAGKAGIAPRPLKSALSLDKIKSSGFKPNDWKDDLKTYIEKEVN